MLQSCPNKYNLNYKSKYLEKMYMILTSVKNIKKKIGNNNNTYNCYCLN